ncbi:hypothetical protein V1527DRAFT_456102 [Lipomyces starkeyi]
MTPQQQVPLPFWNSASAQVSQQLWLPSSSCQAGEWGTDAIAHGWGTCLRWSSGADVHNDFQCKETAQNFKKIRLYPTAEEKHILERWIGTARWTYNECLRAVKVEGVPRSKKALRARAINREAAEMLQKPWLEETPYDIRDAAMDDLLKAFAAGAARYKNDKKPFDIQYRSRNNGKVPNHFRKSCLMTADW